MVRVVREHESYGDYVKLTVSTFKEDVERGLVHMKNLRKLSKPPFQCVNKNKKDSSTSKAIEDEVESSRKI